MTQNTAPNFPSEKTSDILLNVFLETTLGAVDHELDDWSDGITEPLHEEYAGSHRRAAWNYFHGVFGSETGSEFLSILDGCNVVPFPKAEGNRLPLCA